MPHYAQILSIALCIFCLSSPATAQEDSDAERIEIRLDALVDAYMTREQVPGVIAALVVGDEVIVRGYGMADVERGIPVSPDATRFEIGSITKLFTWVAVMMLVEEGKLDLTADVSTYLSAVDVPGAEPLTLAHLMSHRPGYEESYGIFDPDVARLSRPEALAAAAPDQVFPRGTVTSYSNWGVALVGQIIEEVSGSTWETFVQTRILDPLEMTGTTLGEARRPPDQPALSESYRIQSGVAQPAFRIDIRAFAPAGGIASTASDMARFLRFLMGQGALDSVRLLQPDTMMRMRTRLFDDRPQSADMAHGLQSKPQFGTMVYGHGGGLNEFLSNLVFIPEIGAGVFLSQNGGSGVSVPLLVPDLILEKLAADAGLNFVETTAPPDAAVQAQEAAGRYMTNRRTFSGPGQVLAALSVLPITAVDDGALMVPTGTVPAPSRFETIAPDLWEDARGHRVMVIRDAAGQIVQLADGTGAHTHARLRGFADPIWLMGAYAVTLVFATTTLLGLLWRRGLDAGSRRGVWAAGIAMVCAATVWVMSGAIVGATLTAIRLGSQYLFEQPQPTLQAVLGLGGLVALLAGLLVLSLVLVWRAPGWSVWRRLHQSLFALSCGALTVFMLQWGLAFGGPI